MVGRDVRSSAADHVMSADDTRRGLAGRLGRRLGVLIRHDDVAAALRDLQRHLAADAAGAADDDHHLARELLLRRHPLQLGFLERPVLDPERFQPRQRDVVAEDLEFLRLLLAPDLRHRTRIAGAGVFQRVGSLHHVDGVDEELRRDPRLALVLAEPEQPETRNDHDRRVAVAQRRRRRIRERLVVGRVVLPVAGDPFGDARADRVRLPPSPGPME